MNWPFFGLVCRGHSWLVDVSEIFYFFCSGRGRGSPERQGGRGVGFFVLIIPGEGGLPGGGGRERGGREGVCRELGNWGGGGAKFCFWGPKCPPSYVLGNYFRQLLHETLQHNIPGGIKYCSVRIGGGLPWNARQFRLHLQFFSRCCVGNNCCNVTPVFFTGCYLFRIQDIIILSPMLFCRSATLMTTMPARLPRFRDFAILGSLLRNCSVGFATVSSAVSIAQCWVLFRPTFLSVKNSCIFVLCDLVKTD